MKYIHAFVSDIQKSIVTNIKNTEKQTLQLSLRKLEGLVRVARLERAA